MRPIAEWDAPAATEFRDRIVPRARPVVMRGLAADWPLVLMAKAGPDRWLAALSANASAAPVDIIRADPDEQGRFHYRPDGEKLNFIRGHASLPVFLAVLREQAQLERPFAMAVQGLLADRHVRGFKDRHPTPLVPGECEPRLWIGNASKVATHNDPVDNIAVVVAGRRRFTLFPPDSEDNLYMGPASPTPAGTPVSMVHVTAPDLDRFPRFAAAWDAAEQAELRPGDAIFIPKDWFHHVEALDPLNMLVNYWWDPSQA